MLLALIAGAIARIIKLNSVEEKLRSMYGFDSVEINDEPKDKRIEIYLRLKEADIERYYNTNEGEQYLDQVVPEIIHEINYDSDLRNYIMGIAEEGKYPEFCIVVFLTEWDNPRSSAAIRDVGQYASKKYPFEEWFTEKNMEKQEWTRYVGSSWYLKKDGTAVTLPVMERRFNEKSSRQ